MVIKYGLMDPKIKIKNKIMNHPYKEFENTKQWIVIKKVIEKLIENDDIELYTPIEYVVGYLCKKTSLLMYKKNIRSTKGNN